MPTPGTAYGTGTGTHLGTFAPYAPWHDQRFYQS